MKAFQHRTYSTNLFRPRPELYEEVSNNMLVAATPWGPREGAEKAIQTIQDYYFSARGDKESTSPFEFLDCLSGSANDLRVATMLANDRVFKDENENEYNAGVELFAIVKDKEEMSYIQIGHPTAILLRKNISPLVLGNPLDLSVSSPQPEEQLSPLPSNLLGVYEKSNFAVQSFTQQDGDKLLLISKSIVSADFLNLLDSNIEIDLDHIVSQLTKGDSASPFWVGLLQL